MLLASSLNPFPCRFGMVIGDETNGEQISPAKSAKSATILKSIGDTSESLSI